MLTESLTNSEITGESIPSELSSLALDNNETLRHLGLNPNELPPPDEINAIVIPRLVTNLPQFASREMHGPETKELMDHIFDHNPGMLLIRPDFYHIRKEVVNWLNQRGFCTQMTLDLRVTERMYELMYSDVFGRLEAQFSLANRTIVYTDSPAQLVIFTDPNQRFSNSSVADGFAQNYKGGQGKPDSNTLRGSLIYDEARRLGYHKLTDPTIQMAVDPLGTYRYAVRSAGPHSHLDPNDQLLFYTGVGVHIPNSQEMQRDLAILCNHTQLEQIAQHLDHPYIGFFKSLWNSGAIQTPLVIAVGGYAGTGKSSLVNQLLPWLPPTEKIATGQVRAITQTYYPDNPYLHVPTYKLDGLNPGSSLYDAFMRQVNPVSTNLNRIAAFARQEGQNHLFEGNHVFPGLVDFPKGVIPIEMYLQVSDPERHRLMLSGPTHQRDITDHEFEVARQLHDIIIAEAKSLGKPVFEYSEAYPKALDLINQVLFRAIQQPS